MSITNINEKANLIWSIADKLTGVYKPHEYGEVILPLTVIRRFDCILEKTKDDVVKKNAELAATVKDPILRRISGYSFYNTSPFTFKKILDDPDGIEANFRSYLNGFSPNVRNIIEKFKFDNQISVLSQKNLLYIVLKEFTDPKADMHPDKVTNIEMGYIFEEIIRRFSEAHNEDAGQHYTPREVIELMVNILFAEDSDILSDETLVNFAKNNDESTFKHIFEQQFKDIAAQRYEKNEEFFVRMFGDENFLNYMMSLMLPEVYRKLRKK